MSKFAENFNDLLRIKGYTQTSFAKRLGVKQNTVSQWAKGQREPDLECLIEICYWLETTPTDILSYNQVIERKIDTLKTIANLLQEVCPGFEKLSYKERRAKIKEWEKTFENDEK